MAKPAKIEEDSQEPVGPAVVTELHTESRDIFDDRSGALIIGKRGWKKWTPLEAFFDRRRKAEKSEKLSSADIIRLNAGQNYTTLWDTAQASGRDSTQALNLSRGGGSGIPLSQAQSDAIRALVAVESHLGPKDRIIIRRVCGEGAFPSEAVALVSADYTKATTPRFLEALDSLVDAFEAARRRPGVFHI